MAAFGFGRFRDRLPGRYRPAGHGAALGDQRIELASGCCGVAGHGEGGIAQRGLRERPQAAHRHGAALRLGSEDGEADLGGRSRRVQPEGRTGQQAAVTQEPGQAHRIEGELDDIAAREAAQGRRLDMADDLSVAAELDMQAVDAGFDDDGLQVRQVLADQQGAVQGQSFGKMARTEDFGFEGKAQMLGQARAAGGALDFQQQGGHAGDEGGIVVRQVPGQALRAEAQPFDDGLATEFGEIAAPVRQGHQQADSVAALTEIDRRAPQGVDAERHGQAATGRVGAGGVTRGWPGDARIAVEASLDDARAVGTLGAGVRRERARPHAIERQRFGHGQEGDAGSGDALVEIHVLGDAQAFVEAALLDHQRTIKHGAVHDHREVPRQRLEGGTGDVCREPGNAGLPRCRDAPGAAIGHLCAGMGFEPSYQFRNIGGLDRVVGIEEGHEASGRRRDTEVARRRHTLWRPIVSEQREARVARDVVLGDAARGIGRAVVDDDGLPVAACLGEQAVERRGERVRGIVGGNDDGQGQTSPFSRSLTRRTAPLRPRGSNCASTASMSFRPSSCSQAWQPLRSSCRCGTSSPELPRQ